ncbi:MAG: hypothetical protein ATN36_02225 [Epulopiscium sp. Nele67-Bin005]|nr:MAG: hypothetical protein ATN36_02225 [Epulopiscium sp. Nele67-Bin005]
MDLKKQIGLVIITYIGFMAYFMGVFLPTFTENVGGNEMVDAYLVDYSKSIEDIENLVLDYGEEGRAFMTNFFIMDSIYVIISVTLFHLVIKAVATNKYFSYIPFLTGTFDTIENIAVLYTGLSLNMNYLALARFFASAKAVCLFSSIIIIIVGLGKKFIANKTQIS